MRKSEINLIHYQIYRSEIRKKSNSIILNSTELIETNLDRSLISFEPIDKRALSAYQEWQDTATIFPWEDVPRWLNSDLRGLDLALWYGDTLCGLCYASPRKSRVRIKILLIEGNPCINHPLRGSIAALAMLAVNLYAQAMKLSIIEVEDPAPGAVELYLSLGFGFDVYGRLAKAVIG